MDRILIANEPVARREEVILHVNGRATGEHAPRFISDVLMYRPSFAFVLFVVVGWCAVDVAFAFVGWRVGGSCSGGSCSGKDD
jgi:hypothetical protein